MGKHRESNLLVSEDHILWGNEISWECVRNSTQFNEAIAKKSDAAYRALSLNRSVLDTVDNHMETIEKTQESVDQIDWEK